MTEFTKGIVNAVKDRMDESIAFHIFIGHIVIAMIVAPWLLVLVYGKQEQLH